MGGRKGINLRGIDGQCMVVGCTRKALYRSSGPKGKGSRGFCSEHKHLVASEQMQKNKARDGDWFVEYLDRLGANE